jgi:hypothetical protein
MLGLEARGYFTASPPELASRRGSAAPLARLRDSGYALVSRLA